MTKLQEAFDQVGQSIWVDYIRRSFIHSGELQALIDAGLRGMTSNPTIFAEAISQNQDYDDALAALVAAGKSDHEIYETLTIDDIRYAADRFLPLYHSSKGRDGYVSVEVDAQLANNTEGTIEEARQLCTMTNRPNIMIKVPATAAGIPAIATLLGEGINVNVTLMFSQAHYEAVANAYLEGLERLITTEVPLSRVASVASFFVSRVDTAVDKKLAALGNTTLQGKIGIANAKLAYVRYLYLFSSPRWRRLAARGARPQRLLFGSTSTKNPKLPDTLYVDQLMGANTVNTVPRETLQALLDHGVIAAGLTEHLDEAREALNQLAALGIDLEQVAQELQDIGVQKFVDSFMELQEAIQQKRQQLEREPG
ncbi:MAG: transaldolase [Caldilineaceae bacterium]|nr:transaldolase [Caldilineaceae bacterium]